MAQSLFPVFMKSPDKIKKVASTVCRPQRVPPGLTAGRPRSRSMPRPFWARCCAILPFASLDLVAVQSWPQDDLLKARVLHKFIENDFAKLERLVELHLSYADKVAEAEKNQHIVAEVCMRRYART